MSDRTNRTWSRSDHSGMHFQSPMPPRFGSIAVNQTRPMPPTKRPGDEPAKKAIKA